MAEAAQSIHTGRVRIASNRKVGSNIYWVEQEAQDGKLVLLSTCEHCRQNTEHSATVCLVPRNIIATWRNLPRRFWMSFAGWMFWFVVLWGAFTFALHQLIPYDGWINPWFIWSIPSLAGCGVSLHLMWWYLSRRDEMWRRSIMENNQSYFQHCNQTSGFILTRLCSVDDGLKKIGNSGFVIFPQKP